MADCASRCGANREKHSKTGQQLQQQHKHLSQVPRLQLACNKIFSGWMRLTQLLLLYDAYVVSYCAATHRTVLHT
jgi:hypothetical protein